VAATLRPETVFGIVNTWVHPDETYVKASVDGENWYVSERFVGKFADQQHEVPLSIPDGIGKHPPQPVDRLWSFLFVEMHQDFGIAMGLKTMTFLDQLLAEFAVVVDLAIQDRPDRAGLVLNRLMAAGRVNHP
jgi:hypothetical protein